jgi:DNA topoisomerase-3
MVVERELAIRDFVAEDYLEVEATFQPSEGEEQESYRGLWFKGAKPGKMARRLPADGEAAQAIVERARQGQAEVESLSQQDKSMPPPLLYDLTELQRHANRLYGFSARRTLDLAQGLYESKKLISYPRPDSRHLATEIAATLPEIVAAIRQPYEDRLAEGCGQTPLGKRYVNDAKVSDHHAIIPTRENPAALRLSADEAKIYDLICRRLLAAWHGPHCWSVTTLISCINTEGPEDSIVDRYFSQGSMLQEVGWKILDVGYGKDEKPGRRPVGKASLMPLGKTPEKESQDLPPGLQRGLKLKVLQAKTLTKKTRPPK